MIWGMAFWVVFFGVPIWFVVRAIRRHEREPKHQPMLYPTRGALLRAMEANRLDAPALKAEWDAQHANDGEIVQQQIYDAYQEWITAAEARQAEQKAQEEARWAVVDDQLSAQDFARRWEA